MGLFSDANEHSFTGRPDRLTDFLGQHVLEVVGLAAGVGSHSGQSYYSADLRIIDSDNPDVVAGQTVRWTAVKHGKFPQYFFNDVRSLLAAITNTAPESISEEVMEFSVGQAADQEEGAQPLKGTQIRAAISRKVKNGKQVLNKDGEPLNGAQFISAS